MVINLPDLLSVFKALLVTNLVPNLIAFFSSCLIAFLFSLVVAYFAPKDLALIKTAIMAEQVPLVVRIGTYPFNVTWNKTRYQAFNAFTQFKVGQSDLTSLYNS